MLGVLQRVAIVTGAGRGLGRAHALRLAAEGAAVVVNDVGVSIGGVPEGRSPADAVVAEIRHAGGRAIASHHDVSQWQAAGDLVQLAIDTFGGLDVLVNNAGIVRDRTLAKLAEGEWDDVVRVHLKGHAAPTRQAMAYWRAQAEGSRRVSASVIHTTSIAGLAPGIGQAGYCASKAGIAALSAVTALEGVRYGVRSNAIAPSARTRMALEGMPSAGALMPSASDSTAPDAWDPANVAPIVAWLASETCRATGQVFQVIGNRVRVLSMPRIIDEVVSDSQWTVDALDQALQGRLVVHPTIEEYLRL